jgi:pyridinium-3,5-biscarboxylic acid mononucleotide synthase
VRPAELTRLLQRVRRGTMTPAEAAAAIAEAPFERMAFATLDHQRALRTGFPEVVFGLGKTPKQMVAIMTRLSEKHRLVMATRVEAEARSALAAALPHAEIHDNARVVIVDAAMHRAARRPGGRARSGAGAERPQGAQRRGPRDEPEPPGRRAGIEHGLARGTARSGAGMVLVVCAGTADLPVAEEALLTARTMGSRADLVADVGVAGLHRLLAHRRSLRGARVLVVVAGLEGALPSVVGGLTDRPLIAVPTSVGYGAHFRGLAPLLAMLNSCAAGVTVVNIDNGFGAGYAAHLINTSGERP